MEQIKIALEYSHLLFIFMPLIILLTPLNTLINFNYINYHKYVFFIYMITPLHWTFFNDRCFLTLTINKMFGKETPNSNHTFTREYMGWLYNKPMELLGWKWDTSGANKIIMLQFIFIFLILWYVTFFKLKDLL